MAEHLRVIAAQLNFTVGDVQGNTAKIIETIQTAQKEHQPDIIVFPELALSGYTAEDLWFRPDFLQQIHKALEKICEVVNNIYVIVGHPHYAEDTNIYNAASIIFQHKILETYHKQALPNYGVFDEERYFSHGTKPCVFSVKNIPIGLVICEDLWFPEPIQKTVNAGAEIIIGINASPFEETKSILRENIVKNRVQEVKKSIVYVNHICGQDDLIFDGGSFVAEADGHISFQAEFFQEQLCVMDFEINKPFKMIKKHLPVLKNFDAFVYEALVLGVRDYVNKNNFPGVLLGLSGGIDSALVLAIAVDALGADRVQVATLPSQYTSELSFQLTEVLINNFGVKSYRISIDEIFQTFSSILEPSFKNLKGDNTNENLQARIRGILLMALSNKTGFMVLNTSNKSETAMGYTTIYGDMIGGYAPLKDVYKTEVYQLAKFRNSISPLIPEQVIERAPTAELAPNQTDQDTLPPYEILDPILENYIEKNMSIKEIVNAGFAEDVVRKVIRTVDLNEYKRKQAPLGPRVTSRAFTRERRYPITSKYKSE